jgi:nicotinate-nucleotide pyrophosphorylase (carboxylating)
MAGATPLSFKQNFLGVKKMMCQEIAKNVEEDVARALAEDVGSGDLTAALIDAASTAHATIICRDEAVICGQPWVTEVLRQIVPDALVTWHVQDGEPCQRNQKIVEVFGSSRQLLTAERVCLNFLQTLSAVATKTDQYVTAVKGTKASIFDTRKTIPGLRVAQKYAVRCGGGKNHRMGLYDAILIKENHIAAAGGLAAAFRAAQLLSDKAEFIQVEVETLAQLDEALTAGVTMVLLDNMALEMVRSAVALTQGRASLELSGGVQFENLRELAETGVDRISVGGLIKDIKAVDFSMRFLEDALDPVGKD